MARTLLVLALALMTLAAMSVTAAPDQAPRAVCDGGFLDVPGQGPSRALPNGLFEVCLQDGSTVLTHGPDAPEGEGAALPPWIHKPPACVTSETTQYHNRIIYATPSDKPSAFTQLYPKLLASIDQANGFLYQETLPFGVTADFKFLCSAAGIPIATGHTLPTASTADSFSTIVSDLKALGFTNPRAHYWVYYDDAVVCGCSGQGEIKSDSSLSASNLNNVGPRFGIEYGSLLGPAYHTLMHEDGHNMGAVQGLAPHTTGAWHCTDGRDLMCYDDGGPNAGNYNPDVCTNFEHYDCNHDDYYHPNPAAGNYLATHWNIGSCLNRFIQRSGC
jgi:hypothetical protein